MNTETRLVVETHQLVDRFQQVQAKTEKPPTEKMIKQSTHLNTNP